MIEREGKFLVARHAFNFRFGLIGGGVKIGEALKKCIERELNEELSCDVKNVKFLFTLDCCLQRHEVFLVKIKGKPKLNWEVRELREIRKDEFGKGFLTTSTKRIFREFLGEKGF